MDAIEAILSRRSIRKYTTETVPRDVIEQLLKAAMSAPSASNAQPWHFVAIDDRLILEKITEFHQHSSMLREAALAIAVCGDLKSEISEGFWVQDCSAATQNILIAANAKGLGAVWLGCYPRAQRVEGIQNLLGLPDHIIPLSLISIGYPIEKKPHARRYNPSKIRYNHW